MTDRTNGYSKVYAPNIGPHPDWYGIDCPNKERAEFVAVMSRMLTGSKDITIQPTLTEVCAVWFRDEDIRDECWNGIIVGSMNSEECQED